MAKRGPWRPKLPESQKKKRDYKREYKKFKSSPAAKKKAAERQKNRRAALKSWRVKKGDGKDIHHTSKGTRVMSASKNRWIREASRIKGSKRNKKKRGK